MPPSESQRIQTTERGWPLRITLLIAVTVALLPIAVVSILQGIERARIDVSQIHESLVVSARAAASDEENLLASAEQIARALSNLTDVRTVSPRCSSILADALVGVKYFGNLSRIDARGTVVCSALAQAHGRDASHQPIFSAVRRAMGFVVSGQIQSAVLKRPVIVGMLPLRDASGRFDGAVSVVLQLHWLDFMVRAHGLPKEAVVFIYDRNGHLLASNNIAVAQNLIGTARRSREEAGVSSGRDVAGRKWSFAAAPLRGGAINVAFAMPEERLFNATYLHVGADFLMPILMIGLAWAGIWFATERQVNQWIVYLRRVSAAYRRGHYTVRPKLGRAPREFRSLGDGLSSMADSIQDRDNRLRDALTQKSLLIREIHHRVKNNLQIVMSLLSLQAGQLKDAAAREALMQAQVRINALALVHRILHEIEDQTTIDLKRLLHELTHQITEGMHGEAGTIDVEEDIVPREVSGEVAVPLALFAVEALTNVFKYAFPDGKDGIVAVSLSEIEDGKLRLAIRDDGVGFDDNAPAKGMGTRLIRTFGAQIGGVSSLCSKPGGGTVVAVTFPDPDRATRPSGAGTASGIATASDVRDAERHDAATSV